MSQVAGLDCARTAYSSNQAVHISLSVVADHLTYSRFPKTKIIVGHLGERIPSDLFRIDERMSPATEKYQTHSTHPELKRQITLGMPMELNISSYWQTNIWETTSGNFATDLLRFHANTIGLDRIMYSVDYPFVC